VQLVPDDASPIIVQSSRFLGSVAEAELSHEQRGVRRRFVHRPAGDRLKPGDRVAIRLLLVALLACVLALPGCGDGGDAELPVSKTVYHPMIPAGSAIPAPRSIVAIADNRLIILDNAGRVLILDSKGDVVKQWWMPEHDVGKAEGACLLRDGRIVVADTHYHRLVFFDQEGNVLSTYGERGDADGQFHWPIDVIQDPAGFLYVAEYGGNDRIQKFTPDCEHVLTIGSFGDEAAAFQRPSGLAWHDGRLYIADAINNAVKVFTDEGAFVGVLKDQERAIELKFPYDLSIGPDGLLYIIEYQAGRLTVMERTGRVTGRYGRSGRGDGELSTPWGVAVDAHGRVWIADTNNRRIVELRL
jgi:sugar lactone lactonase YvrE